MDFKKTVGKTFKFYGIHDTTFKIGPHLFEAEEDPDDGYRSYMRCVHKVQDERLVFIRRSFAQVRVDQDSDSVFEGYRLVDVDTGHVWLRFGTNHCDDYYPYFVFEYTTPEQKGLEDKFRKVTQAQRYYERHLGDLRQQALEQIEACDYDAAEKTIKKLKREISKANQDKL